MSREGAARAFQRFGELPAAKPLFADLADAYAGLGKDKFLRDVEFEVVRAGLRPTPLYHARRLSDTLGGARIFLKREDTSRADAHLGITSVGQAHLARALGRKRMLAGPRNIKWALAMVSAAARFGLESRVFLDKDEMERHAAIVYQLKLMGAQVQAVTRRLLRGADLREAALDDWLKSPKDSFLFMGLDSGPHPYPDLARELTMLIGRECGRQLKSQIATPPVLVARGGQNADALGLFPAFVEDTNARLICVEPLDPDALHKPAGSERHARLPTAQERQELARAQMILEGQEYPSVTREQEWLRSSGRVEYFKVKTADALKAGRQLASTEGITCALNTAHALAWALATAPTLKPDQGIVLMFAERGDKDIWDIARLEGART